MDLHQTLKTALDNETYVRLTLDDSGHEGFIVGLSKDFVLLQAVYEWQDVGALVIPTAMIGACDVSDYHDDQIRILAFNSVKRTRRYNWVKLDSFPALFTSLQPKGKFVVLSSDDEADVGQIIAVNTDSVDLKAVDPGGNWMDDTFECAYEDITLVQFDDTYSRVLQRYVERAPVLN